MGFDRPGLPNELNPLLGFLSVPSVVAGEGTKLPTIVGAAGDQAAVRQIAPAVVTGIAIFERTD